MKQVVIATKNKGKAKDFEALFGPLGYEVVTMFDVAPQMEIEETGTTFEENAILKAEALTKELNTIVIADDSGLAVDALNGEPGVYSARYAGDHDDEANMVKLLENLKILRMKNEQHASAAASLLQDPVLKRQQFLGLVKVLLHTKTWYKRIWL